MNSEITVREAIAHDKTVFIELAVKLAAYNRIHHNQRCRYDDFNRVLKLIKTNAEKNFNSRDEDVVILIATVNSQPVGYALGRIYMEEETADNGTGRMGLFDELYVDEKARRQGIGQELTEGILQWMKSRNIRRIKLHAYTWNKAAQKLYERNGFSMYASSFEKFI